MVDCATLYARTNAHGKRLADQTLTNGIGFSEDERATIRLAEPLAALAPAPDSTDVRCSRTSSMVDLGGDHYKEWRPLLAYRAGCPPKPRREPTEPPEAPGTAPRAVAGQRGRKPQLHLPIKQQLEVAELYKAGVSVKEIADRFRIHRATVSEICKRRCVPLRNENRGLTREQVQRAALRYVQGASLAAVAKEFGSTPTAIRTALMAAGIEMRPARGGKGK